MGPGPRLRELALAASGSQDDVESCFLGPAFFTIPVDARCEQFSKITKRIPPTASDVHVQAGHLQDRRLHPRHHRMTHLPILRF